MPQAAHVLVRRVLRRARRLPNLRTLLAPRRPAATAPGDVPAALQGLPEVIEYTGEFGAELVLFLPWCNWLSAAGLLRTRRIRTYAGMRCFYEGLDCLGLEEKAATRHYVPLKQRALPVANEHDFDGVGRSPFHLYPDLRHRFAAVPSVADGWDRPVLIVHNKFNSEWDAAPVNHIPLPCLDAMLGRLKHRFSVVYIRHGMRGTLDRAFSVDEFPPMAFDDAGVLARHPEVAVFDDLFAAHRAGGGTQDLNTFKNALYARSYLFITAQGGGAHHIALFSGSLLAILHRRGRETELAYGAGYYSFMANPAPQRVVCVSEDDLLAALPLFETAELAAGRVEHDAAAAALLARFAPGSPVSGPPVSGSPVSGTPMEPAARP